MIIESEQIVKHIGRFIDLSVTLLLQTRNHMRYRSIRVAERFALPTSDHGVAGSNPDGGKIHPEPKLRFIAQSLSCSPFHRLEMTEILLKGRKTLTHPSICGTLLFMTSYFELSR